MTHVSLDVLEELVDNRKHQRCKSNIDRFARRYSNDAIVGSVVEVESDVFQLSISFVLAYPLVELVPQA